MSERAKSITCKLTKDETQALEVIAKLAGWDGKSTALREFMKIWIEVALVTIDTDSTAKGTWSFIKQVQRLSHQMKVVNENSKNLRRESTLAEHDIELLRKAIA